MLQNISIIENILFIYVSEIDPVLNILLVSEENQMENSNWRNKHLKHNL